MIISREIINKNIKFHDVSFQDENSLHIETFGYNELSKLIDKYKYLLLKNNAKEGHSAVIGELTNIYQIALVFACAEIGVSISIVDNPNVVKGKIKNAANAINEKTKILLPINFLLYKNNSHSNDKIELLRKVCLHTLVMDNYELDVVDTYPISAKNESIFLKCSSSGTTDTPKLINHNHAFMHDLIKRNSSMFFGNVAMIANLNHGSSPATYFLPALASDNVTDFYNITHSDSKKLMKIINLLYNSNLKINHLMLPYTKLIDDLLLEPVNLQDCIIYTLGVIKSEWLKFVNFKIKDVISIFGTSETSGHLMINQASDIDFAENSYKVLDDFYKIEINSKNQLEVVSPIYNNVTTTGDTFKFENGKYVHLARSNLYRINDLNLDIIKYKKLIKTLGNADLILDLEKEKIYLAIWDNSLSLDVLSIIDNTLKEDSNGLHFISDYDFLKYEDFLTGIKLDAQLLREYFRSK